MSDFEPLLEKLEISFTDKELLQQVFVHRSYLNEHRSFPLGHNERLEFLGDAVLELVVTEYLYSTYPNPEGELTNWRSALVKGETLADIASNLGFSEYLLLSSGEIKSGGRTKNQLLANALEALLGALYLDQGYEVCQGLISRLVLVRLPKILEHRLFVDPKSQLQELTQERFNITPTYTLLSEEGPDHSKLFEVAVWIGTQQLGVGNGQSKQAGQIAAAAAALKVLITAS